MPEEDKTEGWLSNASEGGLPQLLAGPAGKAISRLIGAVAEVPAAYLDSLAQGIRDKTEARSILSKALAEKAAEIAVNDPEVLDRAMTNMLARSYRAQKNKDAIARIAIEELAKEPPAPDSKGPSEDWMNKFETYAEDASSEDLRLMFGKLLAGEIREPGAVSRSTLNFVSFLDPETAKLIERVLPSCCLEGLVILESVSPKLSVEEKAYLEQSGFCTIDRRADISLDEEGKAIVGFFQSRQGLMIQGVSKARISLSAALLSRAGRDLVKVVRSPCDIQAFASVLFSSSTVHKIFLGDVSYTEEYCSISSMKELSRNQ